jgi:hypothetical protein
MGARSRTAPAAIAAVAAVVFILSMFLDWYSLDLPAEVDGRETNAPSINAFEGLQRADIALVVVALPAWIAAAGCVALGGGWAYLAGPRLEFEDDEVDWEEDEASSPRPDPGT